MWLTVFTSPATNIVNNAGITKKYRANLRLIIAARAIVEK
jgi:hypothetical protein